jgi:hypothetical protein
MWRVVFFFSVFFTRVMLAEPVFAQTDSPNGTFTFYGVSQPQGPVTASYLRMRHPLYLLDLCREVKAGRPGRERLEGLVGDRNVLNALLAMDLDALYQKLTGPPDPAAPRSTQSLWYQILTDAETAPLPRVDAPADLNFEDVNRGDSPSRLLRLTSLVDGTLEARLPSDSAFQIRSMRTYDGVILEVPPIPDGPGAQRREASQLDTFRSPELSRTQARWVLPVTAGQDIDIEVGLPAGRALPPDGLSSILTVTVGGSFAGSIWQITTPILAKPVPFPGNIYITVFAPQVVFDVVSEPSYNPNVPRTFNVFLEVSDPFPAVTVKGSVQPLSFPSGLSMSNSTFILQPQGFISLSLTLSIDRQSQAWLTQNVLQPFSLRVAYQTLSPPFASGVATVQLFFTVYPGTQSWLVKGTAGKGFLGSAGVQCTQWVVLYSDGTLVRDGDCDNRNAFNAKVVSDGYLAGIKIVSDVYFMGWFSQDFKYSKIVWAYGQANYVSLRSQPLLMWWTKL